MILIALVSAAALCALGVVLELGARFWFRHRQRYYVWPPALRMHFYPDRSRLPEYEDVLRVEYNSDGERGGEPRDAPHSGLYRVLALGGSAVEGLSLDQSSNWPHVLERLLQRPASLRTLEARRVHVGTIGRSAISARDLDLILERVLPRYRRLDAMLIMIGAGDVTKWLASGAPGHAPAPPAPSSSLFASHPEGPFGWRPSNSALIALVKHWRRLMFRPVRVRRNAGGWIVAARRMRSQAREIRATTGDPTLMLDDFATHFARLLNRAQQQADRVLVLRTPWFEKDYTADEAARLWHGGVGHPWAMQTIDVYYAFEVVNRLMRLVDTRASEIAERLGVECVDVGAALDMSLTDYYDYTHFTPSGARKVAGVVAAALLKTRAQRASDRSAPHSVAGGMRR